MNPTEQPICSKLTLFLRIHDLVQRVPSLGLFQAVTFGKLKITKRQDTKQCLADSKSSSRAKLKLAVQRCKIKTSSTKVYKSQT